MTKLIGYRKLKSFEIGRKGEISNIELGSSSVWMHYYSKDCGELYRVYLDMDLPEPPSKTDLTNHWSEIALEEENAKRIVLKHIGETLVSIALTRGHTMGVLTPRFRQISPTVKLELLQSMELRVEEVKNVD